MPNQARTRERRRREKKKKMKRDTRNNVSVARAWREKVVASKESRESTVYAHPCLVSVEHLSGRCIVSSTKEKHSRALGSTGVLFSGFPNLNSEHLPEKNTYVLLISTGLLLVSFLSLSSETSLPPALDLVTVLG